MTTSSATIAAALAAAPRGDDEHDQIHGDQERRPLLHRCFGRPARARIWKGPKRSSKADT